MARRIQSVMLRNLEADMNYDEFKTHWPELRDSAHRYFSKLTDGDMTAIDGDYEKLVQLLQKRYGYSKERAQDEFDGFFAESSRNVSNASSP